MRFNPGYPTPHGTSQVVSPVLWNPAYHSASAPPMQAEWMDRRVKNILIYGALLFLVFKLPKK